MISLLRAAAVATSLAAAAAAAGAGPLPVPAAQPERILRALEIAAAQREETVATWIALCSIPALPGQERARAEEMARLLADAGMRARVLPDGNVEGSWAGTEPGPPVVIAAHLDALHAPGPGLAVRRGKDVLEGPGVLDDGSGLAAMVAAARALNEAGWRPRREVRFLGTVSEEVGLVGARSYLGANPDVAAYVAVDGILGRVEHAGMGIRWTRWTFSGRGGHTLVSAQLPSPSIAAARAVAAMADAADESDALLNVGEIRGGSMPNAVPMEVVVVTDLRAEEPAVLATLARACEDAAQRAAAGEGVSVRTEILQDLPAARLPGHESSALVRGAADILRFLGVPPMLSPRGSSEASLALLRGIPAIGVGVTTGRGAHSPTEVAEIAPLLKGTQQVILLTVMLGEGGE